MNFNNLYRKCEELYKDSHYFNVIHSNYIINVFYNELSGIIKQQIHEYDIHSTDNNDKEIDWRNEQIENFINKHFIHHTKYLNMSSAQVQEMHPIRIKLLEELNDIMSNELYNHIYREIKIHKFFDQMDMTKFNYVNLIIEEGNKKHFITFLSK